MTMTEQSINRSVKKIGADPINRLVFKEKGKSEVYLVGGYVRDILIKRTGPDRDYVVKHGMDSFMKRIALRIGGRIIRIGSYGLRRIILRDGRSLDFSPLSGSIEEDVSARDFTINALAWSPETGLLDPEGGLQDMAAGLIRAVKTDNIARDPVRILRAYRLACELDFRIERETARALRRFGVLIRDAKSERITLEIFRIMNAANSSKTLAMMVRNDILGRIIYRANSMLSRNIKALSMFQRLLDVLPEKHNFRLGETFSHNLSRLGLLRLEHLLAGDVDHGLALSSRIRDRIRKIDRGLSIHSAKGRVSRGKLFELFEGIGDGAEDFLLIRRLTEYLPEYRRYLKVIRKPNMPAEEIVRLTGPIPGPDLGRLIRALRRGQFLDEKWTKADSRRMLHKLKYI
ncbi:MAG: hypothetical protein M0Z79_12035 [Nitrospiraceae bacterium]|nr:hypothetical protein [Nitrospiraceae bacterium]